MGISEKGIPWGIWKSTAGVPQPGHKVTLSMNRCQLCAGSRQPRAMFNRRLVVVPMQRTPAKS